MIERHKTGRIRMICALAVVCGSAFLLAGCKGRQPEETEAAAELRYVTGEVEESKRSGEAAVSAEGSVGMGQSSQGPDMSLLTAETAMAPAITFTDVSDTIYIKGSDVRLRAAPSTSDDNTVAAVLNAGTKLERTGDSSEWCRVRYNGQTLYVFKSLITTTAPAAGAASAGTGAGQSAGSGQSSAAGTGSGQSAGTGTANSSKAQVSDGSQIQLDSSWKYAEFSAIHTGSAVMHKSTAADKKGITVCVNAGHGTSGGGNAKTLCHPDGTPKVTGGSTSAGATKATAVSAGMTFADGTPEPKVTLALALVLRDKLLAAGYDVVMIRESDDVQLDNIARTVIANNTADCHIAIHWDSSTSDKGAFYMSVPNVASYRAMEPVASNWQKHNTLGENLVAGLRGAGVKIFSNGAMEMDLTQTSYSTIPSVDIEMGDKVSDHSAAALEVLANGLLAGINSYFGK